ncbi:MAG TPA: hypothetical protein PKC43_09635 [Phycisphaerales bacterium]|nr:hypothetical protein [Phycisphaerales bacterium]HMP37695.1 hypothetical protein [Phycisphaerales bacterium]
MLLIAALLGIEPATAAAGVTASVSIDSGAPLTFPIAPRDAGMSPCGPLYADVLVAPGARVGWNALIVGGDYGQFAGEIIVANESTVARSFDVRLVTPLDPDSFTLLGGTASLTMRTPSGGGSMSSTGAHPVVEVAIDSQTVAALFDAPFSLAGAGCLMGGPESFGAPIPSFLGPPVLDDAALRTRFELSAGAEVAIAFCIFVELPSTAFIACGCLPPPASILCSAGAITEAEPCGAAANDGCALATPSFDSIACGDVICGTAFAAGCHRDEDWYELAVTQETIATIAFVAEFPVRVAVLPQSGGTPCAPIPTPVAIGSAPAGFASELVLCMSPGTYRIVVGVDALTGHPCGAGDRYEIALDCCTSREVSFYALSGSSTNVGWEWQIETSEFIAEGTVDPIPFGDPAIELAEALKQAVSMWSGNVSCGPIDRLTIVTFGICPVGNPDTALVMVSACVGVAGSLGPYPILRVRQIGSANWCVPSSTPAVLACSALFGCAVNPSFVRLEPVGADCNRNGIDDAIEILTGDVQDLDGDWIPDECATCGADLDGNGIVDGADLGVLLGSWGAPGAGDLDGNGVVDGADLGLLLAAWGECG